MGSLDVPEVLIALGLVAMAVWGAYNLLHRAVPLPGSGKIAVRRRAAYQK